MFSTSRISGTSFVCDGRHGNAVSRQDKQAGTHTHTHGCTTSAQHVLEKAMQWLGNSLLADALEEQGAKRRPQE
eukprot:1984069-Amphidinium_carterae.1